MQRFVVCLAGQLGVNVTQVLISSCIARIGPDCHVERSAGLVVLTARCEQHGEVVVRLGQIRVILRQLGKDRDGFRGLALLREHHTLDETHLHVTRILAQKSIDPHQRFG